jgi:hypothetical protein
MVLVSVMLPEVPVMVTVEEPVAAVLPAVSVRTLELVDEAGLNEAVTPLGRPDAANATLPVNPPTSVTEMVSVALLPCVTAREDAEGVRAKPAVVTALTVRVMVVVAVVLPEVPVMVTVDEPVVAALLAVSVSTLLLVDEAGLNEAVTPLGRPDAVNATLPVNPPTSVTEMVSVALLPCVTASVDAERDSVKLDVLLEPVPTNVMMLCAGNV